MTWFRASTYFLAVLLLVAPTLAAICPDGCICTTTRDGLHRATCSNLAELYKFTIRQKNHNINILNLSHNNITKLNHELDRLTEVVTLDLSTNGIQNLNKFLHNAKKLVHLNLANNRIKELSLTYLPKSVSSLDLTNNLLHDVPSDLQHLISLEHLELEGNPLDCSCENLMARDRLLSGNVFIDSVRCASPMKFKGRSWLELKTKDICKVPKSEVNYLDMMMGDQPIDAVQVGEETTALKSMPLVASNNLEQGKIIQGDSPVDYDDNLQFLKVGKATSSSPFYDIEGSGEAENTTISDIYIEPRISHKLDVDLMTTDKVIPFDDAHTTIDPMEESRNESGFIPFHTGYNLLDQTTTPIHEDQNLLEDDVNKATTEFFGFYDIEGSGEAESTTISGIEPRISRKLDADLMTTEEVIPFDDTQTTVDPNEGSWNESGFIPFDLGHDLVEETTTPIYEDFNHFEDDVNKSTTEFFIFRDIEGSGEAESTTISSDIEPKISGKLDADLMTTEEVIPFDDAQTTIDPMEGSTSGFGLISSDLGHDLDEQITTPVYEDINPEPVHKLFEDDVNKSTTEFPLPEPPSVYQGGADWNKEIPSTSSTERLLTSSTTRDTTVSEQIRVTQASEVLGQIPPNSENTPPHKTGTYVCIAIIVILLVGLIGFAIIKGQMRKRRDRRLIRQQKRDVEKASKEMVDMNKSLLGKPATLEEPIENKINGKYELVPTHELHQKKGENGEVTKGNSHSDSNGLKTDSPRDTNQNKSSSRDNNLTGDTLQQETSFESAPASPDSRKDNNSLSSEDIFTPLNNEDMPRLNGNADSDTSHPLINGDQNTDSDFLSPSREYVPVYSPDMGRVRIKMTETVKPKTPVLVTRSRSNAGDIVITPSRDANTLKSTT